MAAKEPSLEELLAAADDARAKTDAADHAAQAAGVAHEMGVQHHENLDSIYNDFAQTRVYDENPGLVQRMNAALDAARLIVTEGKRKRDECDAEAARWAAERDRLHNAVMAKRAMRTDDDWRRKATPAALKELYSLWSGRDRRALQKIIEPFNTRLNPVTWETFANELATLARRWCLSATMHESVHSVSRTNTTSHRLTILLVVPPGSSQYYINHTRVVDGNGSVRTYSGIEFFLRGDHVLTLSCDSTKEGVVANATPALQQHYPDHPDTCTACDLFAPHNPTPKGGMHHRFSLMLLQAFPYGCLNGSLRGIMERYANLVKLRCLFVDKPIPRPVKPSDKDAPW